MKEFYSNKLLENRKWSRRSISQLFCSINESLFTINEKYTNTISQKRFCTIRINGSSVSNKCSYSKKIWIRHGYTDDLKQRNA